MTDVLIDTRRLDRDRSGRHPGTVLAGQVARRAARSGALWGLIFGVFVFVQTFAYTSSYRTQAARDELLLAYESNIGINALIGPVRAINTVGGFASWRFVGILSVLGSVWGLLTSTRLMRGEEEAGRYDLLLAGQTTRRLAAAQAVAGLGVGLLALFVLTALGTVVTGRAPSVGFSPGACLYFAVTLVAAAAMFLAIGALASQLANTRRRAAAMAGVVLGISYSIRMVADSSQELHWLVWLSPLGWLEESRPLTDPQPMALLPVLALVIATTAGTLHLAGTRDLGAATFPDTDSARPRLTLVGGPTRLALRLMRPVALGWLLAIMAFSVLLGTVAESSAKDVKGSQDIGEAIGRLGGQGSLVTAYLGLTFLVLALLIALVSAGQISAIRTEEADGRLENLLVRPVNRSTWLAQRLGLAALLLVIAGLVAAIGAWAGATSQNSDVRFGSLLAAGLNVVSPALLLLGLGALVLGAWPRRTSTVVYGYLAWSFLVEFAGGAVHINHWLMDTSVLFHLVPAPAASPNWSSVAVITGLGVTGAIVGGFLFCRRDLTSG